MDCQISYTQQSAWLTVMASRDVSFKYDVFMTYRSFKWTNGLAVIEKIQTF